METNLTVAVLVAGYLLVDVGMFPTESSTVCAPRATHSASSLWVRAVPFTLYSDTRLSSVTEPIKQY